MTPEAPARPPAPDPVLRRARLAVTAIFLINGITFASWFPHIPVVKARLGLSEGVLGFVLLAMALGAILAFPLAGWLIARLGSRAVTGAAGIGFCAALPLPILAPDPPFLALALALFGACNGAMDVAMNAQGLAVENRYPRPIMSSLHGLFSVGALVGASLAGAAMSVGLSPAAHAFGIAVPMLAAMLLAMGFMLPRGADAVSGGPTFARPTGALVGLGLLAFLALVAEGAVADWSAVYLYESLGTEAGMAAAGFAAFSLTMAIGRFTGDALVRRFSGVGLLRASATLASLGLALALLAGHPALAVAGFACVGLGMSNIVPILFRAAGRVPGVPSGIGIAAVATAGYFGFLAGPPAIGLAAEAVTLPVALGLAVLATALIAALAHVSRRDGAGEPVAGAARPATQASA